MNDGLGKIAETKIREWLDRPQAGYSFDRFYDQLSGFYQTSRNICDFVCYKYPNQYYIESKATWSDRFDFSMIQQHQLDGLIQKSTIPGCYGWIIILFASHKRAFRFNATDIKNLIDTEGVKSLNISKIDRWKISYKEIRTIPNTRKTYLDYIGELEELL